MRSSGPACGRGDCLPLAVSCRPKRAATRRCGGITLCYTTTLDNFKSFSSISLSLYFKLLAQPPHPTHDVHLYDQPLVGRVAIIVGDDFHPRRISVGDVLQPFGDEATERVVALTLHDSPAEATHWTGAMMAKAVGVSVQQICRAHGLRLPSRYNSTRG